MESKMNERIEKLSQLAWTKTSEAVPFYDSTGNISRDFNLKYQQKFAELIVKEAGALLMSPEFIGRSDLDWSMVLNEHFGVEE